MRHTSYFPTDLLLAKTPYQVVTAQRARLLDPIALGFPLPYLSPEDVVVHKLLAYRFRARDDVKSFAKADVPLDEEYIRTGAPSRRLATWEQFRSSQRLGGQR